MRGFTRRVRRWLIVVLLLGATSTTSAEISLRFASNPAGLMVTGGETGTATVNFGAISAIATPPLGVTRTYEASTFTLSTPFDVSVVQVVGISTSYTLQARLNTVQTFTWMVGGQVLTTTYQTLLPTPRTYDTLYTHNLAFRIPYTTAPGSISTVLDFLAIAN
jgi:hypothetical protein